MWNLGIRNIKINRRGKLDLVIGDESGNRRLVIEVKRITNQISLPICRAYVEGKGIHAKDGFPRDMDNLREEKDAERAFVIFDPQDMLDNYTMTDFPAKTWKQYWYDQCSREPKIAFHQLYRRLSLSSTLNSS